MRIALVTNEYATESSFAGGLAQYARRAAELLHRFGHEVEVFVWSDRDETFAHHGVTVHRISGILGRWFRLTMRLTSGSIRQPLQILTMNERLRRRFLPRHRQKPFDIIQSHSVWAPTVTALRGCKTPVVTRVSSYQPLWSEAYGRERSWQLWCRERMEILQMRTSQEVYAPSRLVAGALRQHEGIQADVVEPPIFIERAKTDSSLYSALRRNGPYVLFVGTLGRMKGVDLLARALRIVLAERKDLHAVFAGSDLGLDGEPAWAWVCRTLGEYASRATYLGQVRHVQLFPVVAGSSAIALPSRIDNLPNACLEAMAHGAVVVASRGASFEQLITHGENGFLVPQEDHEALASALLKVVRLAPSRRAEIGAKAKARINQMSPERTIPRLVEYYRRVIRSTEGAFAGKHNAHCVLDRRVCN